MIATFLRWYFGGWVAIIAVLMLLGNPWLLLKIVALLVGLPLAALLLFGLLSGAGKFEVVRRAPLDNARRRPAERDEP